MRFFNTAGDCFPKYHYMVPPEPRLPEARGLIERGSYFVVHAPRQTGKTTTLRSLAMALTAEGTYAALRFSCEVGEVAGDDDIRAQWLVLGQMAAAASVDLPSELRPPPWPAEAGNALITAGLMAWAAACPRPLVLFFDEIDALRGQSLISVLRQLRAGHALRLRPDGDPFPWSVVLCGLRDVRDYKAASGGDPGRLGTASPFNVKVASLKLGNFTEADVRMLYGQYTAETGQRFEDDALKRAFELTEGQPWLVNALAAEIVDQMKVPLSEPITVEHVEQAKERLILKRETHLDSLVSKLEEPRVRRIIEPVIAGTFGDEGSGYNDDFEYVRDLGLVASDNPVRIANRIYHEVITRVLSLSIERRITDEPRAFVLPDGRFDTRLLLERFAEFWRENGEIIESGSTYREVAAQLVLMAFVHRIVNGGGFVAREYGIGRGRIDICIKWPYPGPDGKRAWQQEAIELKVWHPNKPDPLAKGLVQLEGYLDRFGLKEGTLVIFDRRPGIPPPEERTHFEQAVTPKGYAVTLLRA